ncbi:MAG: pseudaminic acid synthase [Saprospiraceae bacterium]
MNFKIGNVQVGDEAPCFIIAELSANHNQRLDVALETVRAAKAAGADCIKLQHYKADTITIDCGNKYFQINQGTLWDGTTLYKLYQEAFMPWEWTPEIMKAANAEGLLCFSSPFDFTAVDFLEQHDVPAYKIASFEITDIPLIAYVAAKGKPVIISTGIAGLEDIELAIKTCREAGNDQIALLKCTSSYPAALDEVNLKTIPDMMRKYKAVIGLSDHTIGVSVPVASVALGAKIIEKHFILDKNLGGPDASFSLEPAEFKLMVDSVRDVEKSLGTISYELSPKVLKSREFSRSLFIVKDVMAGEAFTVENVRSIRPGFGLHPKHLNEIMGKKAIAAFEKGTPFTWEMIQP